MKQAINAAGAPRPIGPYSPAIDAGSLVFVRRPDRRWTRPPASSSKESRAGRARAQEHRRRARRGRPGLVDVVKTTCFLADIDDFTAFNEVYARYFGAPAARGRRPGRALPRGARVEIEAIAVRA